MTVIDLKPLKKTLDFLFDETTVIQVSLTFIDFTTAIINKNEDGTYNISKDERGTVWKMGVNL